MSQANVFEQLIKLVPKAVSEFKVTFSLRKDGFLIVRSVATFSTHFDGNQNAYKSRRGLSCNLNSFFALLSGLYFLGLVLHYHPRW